MHIYSYAYIYSISKNLMLLQYPMIYVNSLSDKVIIVTTLCSKYYRRKIFYFKLPIKESSEKFH